MEKLIRLIESYYDDSYSYYSRDRNIKQFSANIADEIADYYDLDSLDENLINGLIEDYKKCEKMEDFIKSESFTALVNFLHTNDKLITPKDKYYKEKFMGFYSEKMFIEIFSRINDEEYKRQYVNEHESIAYAIFQYGNIEDEFFPDSMKYMLLNGYPENIKMCHSSHKLEFKQEDLREMFDFCFEKIDNMYYYRIPEVLMSYFNLQSKFEFLKIGLEKVPTIVKSYSSREKEETLRYLKRIYDILSDEEKQMFAESCKGQNSETFLDYINGEIKPMKIHLALFGYYADRFDSAELKRQLDLFGVPTEDIDFENKEKSLKQSILKVHSIDSYFLESFINKYGLLHPCFYSNVNFRLSILEHLHSLNNSQVSFFELVYNTLKEKDVEIDRSSQALHKLLNFKDNALDNILSLMASNGSIFRCNGHDDPPIKSLIDDYVAQNRVIQCDEEKTEKIIEEVIKCNCYDTFLTNISLESISNYLKGKSVNDERDSYIFSNLLGFLEKEQIRNLEIDEFKRAELFIRARNVKFADIFKCYDCFEDDYLRSLITQACDNGHINKEAAVQYLYDYQRIKEEYSNLTTDEERRDYLITLHIEQPDVPDNFFTQQNLMKKSLLKDISNHECRLSVIGSFNNVIDSKIQENVNVAQAMLRELFESQGPLTPENEETIEMVFNSFSVFAVPQQSFSDSTTNGECYYLMQEIKMLETREYPICIVELLHEYVHAFLNRDFNEKRNHFGDDLEEGLADSIAEIAYNEYMKKHEKVVIGDTTYNYDDYVETQSAYKVPNMIVKSMLYGLEAIGEDKSTIIETCLGNKQEFIERIIHRYEDRKYSDKRNYNYINLNKITPLNIFNWCGDIISLRESQRLSQESPYLHRNYGAVDYIMHLKTQHDEGYSLENYADWNSVLDDYENLAAKSATRYVESSAYSEPSSMSLSDIKAVVGNWKNRQGPDKGRIENNIQNLLLK